MSANTYDDSGLQTALREYFDIKKNLDPAKEIKRRAKNVGLKLVKYYKDAAPTKEEIMRVGYKARVRPRIKAKGMTRAKQVKMELAARSRARTLTAAGWFPAVIALGGTPRLNKTVRGSHLGSVKQELGGKSPSVTLTNAQPGAEHTDDKANGAIQRALDAEVADITKYLDRKQEEAARKAGL